MDYFYLHGFASSPRSTKAKDLGQRFGQEGISLTVPDLNQNDFSHLTLSRQLRQAAALFPAAPSPVTVIGSSFGGLTAAWLGQLHPQVDRLVLLAPAFRFLDHWLPRLGEQQVRQWRETGTLSVYHYGEAGMLPLSYGFVEDALTYREAEMQRPVPTLVLHGVHDEVIQIAASVEFADDRPWVTLVKLDSDHALTDVSQQVWELIKDFCGISRQ